MIQNLLSLVPNWGWFGVGTGALGLGVAAFFFPSVVISALLAVLNGVIAATQTVWEKVFWPGLRDILEDWVTVVTVACAALGLYVYLKADFLAREAALKHAMVQCQTDVKNLKKTAQGIAKSVKGKQPSSPLEWIFK